MSLNHLTNTEIAERLAHAIRAWRISPQGAGISQVELAHKSGMGLTPLKRFEKTGAITLRNLVALLRALNLLDGLETLVPEPDAPGPLALLAAEKNRTRRKRAPRRSRPRRSRPRTSTPRTSTPRTSKAPAKPDNPHG
jgi:hypothetical protein